ncbi:MAG: hypothetical protein EOP47_18270 [Sphingobacteriaceae bacterium]|nr:MAG: hypothetical protein EOP47_18270 [Sphingobacteriaceae bacterium]
MATLSYAQKDSTQGFKKLEWLTGNWTRTKMKAGSSGYERWEKVSPTKLIGEAATIKGADTIFKERTQLIIKGNDVFYVVDASGNTETVYFKMTSITTDGFVCEAPEHDFPKMITYKLTGNAIKATISGDGKEMDFYYVRVD